MAILYTAETLLDSIRQVGGLNNVQTEGNDDARLLQDVYEVQRERILPYLLRAKAEYLVSTVRVPAAPRVRIPARAIGNMLRDLWFIDSGGTRQFLGTTPLPREELHKYADSGGGPSPAAWFIEGNYVQLVPISGTYVGSLEMAFYSKPSVLVSSGAYGVVQSVNPSSRQVTLATTPPNTFQPGAAIDIHSPESGAEIKLQDLTVSTVVGSTITFAEAIDGSTFGTTAAAVGDYVCLAHECAVIQVPEDVVPMVIASVALRKVVADGQPVKAQMLAASIKSQEEELLQVIQSRVEGKEEIVHGYGAISGWSGGV